MGREVEGRGEVEDSRADHLLLSVTAARERSERGHPQCVAHTGDSG